ncbi:MFS transporter [Pseudoalteromonas sp. Cnat2-41]|uniref:MFS transporter n=1 Tax=unclassified Pseudoalteromonas TaxID=194690 RepID=UPI001EF91698|nr:MULTISPECIES: MFS transporter [unclassified Pseudoalteromonas]MCF2862558.1 MFS transporter [Pseudoalteromonas sp. CNAT2-18]MCG7558990.1 MFS transporter [Pseudoalteromonas sp. CNAT2-18.1]
MSASQLNTVEKRAAVSLASVFAFRMLGLFMLMPVLAVYGQSLSGFSPLWIGLAIGAYGLTQALLQIPMGWLSDRIGRKRVIIGGLVLFTLGSMVAACAESMYTLTLGRALQGMGAIASALLALAADLSRDEQRPKVMAVIGMCIGMSFAVAMLLGPMVAASFGVSGIFWLTAALAVLGMAIVTWMVPTAVNRAPKGETSVTLADVGKLVRHPDLARLDLGVLFLHLSLTTVFVSLPTQLIADGLEAAKHWQLYIPVFVLSFVLMVPMMIVAVAKQKEKPLFLVAIVMLIVSMLGLVAGAHSVYVIAACMMLYFVAFNFLEATMPALVSRLSPANQKGSAMGVFSSSQFLGAFLGGILGGYVAQTGSPEMVFAAAAVVGVIWLVIAAKMRVPPRSKIISLLSAVDSEQDAQQLAGRLVALPGVLEATVVCDENRSYLKVDDKKFDLEAAQRLVAAV